MKNPIKAITIDDWIKNYCPEFVVWVDMKEEDFKVYSFNKNSFQNSYFINVCYAIIYPSK